MILKITTEWREEKVKKKGEGGGSMTGITARLCRVLGEAVRSPSVRTASCESGGAKCPVGIAAGGRRTLPPTHKDHDR